MSIERGSMSDADRRRYERITAGLPVNVYYTQDGSRFLKGKVFNISDGGIGLELRPSREVFLSPRLDAGQMVTLHLLFPLSSVEIKATVRWSDPTDANGVTRLGVQLYDAPGNLFHRWVESSRQSRDEKEG